MFLKIYFIKNKFMIWAIAVHKGTTKARFEYNELKSTAK